MRLMLHLQPLQRTSAVPLDQYPLAATIYRLLASVAPDYAAFLHEEGFAASGAFTPAGAAGVNHKRFKFFVFSRLAQRGKRIDGPRQRIILNENLVTWQIGSPLDEMMGLLAESLWAQPALLIGDHLSQAAFSLVGVDVVAPPPLTAQLRGELIAPLLVTVSKTNAAGQRVKDDLRPDDERFAVGLWSNLREKQQALGGAAPARDDFEFRFTEPPRSQLVQYKGGDHKGWLGRFVLRGDAALLRLAWEAGLGQANSKGFGMMQAL